MTLLLALALMGPDVPPDPFTVSDYDEGDVYFLRGDLRRPHHGMRQAWVFNRALEWVVSDGTVLCVPAASPLFLSGTRQVSRWFTAASNEVSEADEETSRFVKKDPKVEVDHVSLPPFQFPIEAYPAAELEVTEATHPWQFLVGIKGRSGPPLFIGPWREGSGSLSVDLLGRYRGKGYRHHFAHFQFFLAVWTRDPGREARLSFRLRLRGVPALIPCLPVIRRAVGGRAEGMPLAAVAVDGRGRRLGRDTISVEARVGGAVLPLVEAGEGVWRGTIRDLPPGDHRAELRAVWKGGGGSPWPPAWTYRSLTILSSATIPGSAS